MGAVLKPGEQSDGSIVDLHGNVISSEQRESIIESVAELPVHQKMNDILAAVSDNPIVLINSATGSGKTTVIPSTLQAELGGTVRCNIPRNTIAQSVSGWVSNIHLSQSGDPRYSLGENIGYITGKGREYSPDKTNVVFQTYGYDLRRLANGADFPDIYCLDEFHSNNLDKYLFASFLRKDLLGMHKDTKVVIFSATLDTFAILEYFKSISRNIPVIDVPGRQYPIDEHHIQPSEFLGELQKGFDLGENTLVFESGKREIKERIAMIQAALGSDVVIDALHGEMSLDQQREIIQKKSKTPRIIVATNIAEEGLTVDIDRVFDMGEHKEISVNHHGVEEIATTLTSDAGSKQRKGRVGRLRPGTAYRCNNIDLSQAPLFDTPVIGQTTIESGILIALARGEEYDILSEMRRYKDQGEQLFLHEPDSKLVSISYERLFRIGAIDTNGITLLGKELLQFPVSVFNARVLIESIKRETATLQNNIGANKRINADILEMVCLQESGGIFDTTGSFKELFATLNTSDLDYQKEWFRLLISEELSESTTNTLGSKCGVSFDSLNYFQSCSDKMLFECLSSDDYETLGIKKIRINEALRIQQELESRLTRMGITATRDGTKDDKICSLISGYVHNIFEYSDKDNGFTSYTNHSLREVFKASKASMINTNIKGSNLYLGNPFIIKEEDDDVHLLSNIIKVYYHQIAQFMTELSTRFSLDDFDFISNSEIHRIHGEYKKQLNTSIREYHSFSQKNIYESLVESFLNEAESGYNSQEYMKLYYSAENIHTQHHNNTQNATSLKFASWKNKIVASLKGGVQPGENVGLDSLMLLDLDKTFDGIKSKILEMKQNDKNINSHFISQVLGLYSKDANKAYKYLASSSELSGENIGIAESIITSIDKIKHNLMDWHDTLFNAQKSNNNDIGGISSTISQLGNLNKKQVEFQKKYQWVQNFLQALEDISQGKKIELRDIGLGTTSSREQALLNDSVLASFKFYDRSIQQKNYYNNIKNIHIPGIQDTTYNNTISGFFSTDRRKYQRSCSNMEKYLQSFHNNIATYKLNIGELEALKQSLSIGYSDIKALHIQIDAIETQISKYNGAKIKLEIPQEGLLESDKAVIIGKIEDIRACISLQYEKKNKLNATKLLLEKKIQNLLGNSQVESLNEAEHSIKSFKKQKTKAVKNLELLEQYYIGAQNIQNDIGEIPFDKPLLQAGNKSVYTKNFLIGILSSIILPGQTIYSLNASVDAFEKRVEKYALDSFFENNELTHLGQDLQNINHITPQNLKILMKRINGILDKFEQGDLMNNLKSEGEELEEKSTMLWKENIQELLEGFEGVVREFLSEDIVNMHRDSSLLKHLPKLVQSAHSYGKFKTELYNFFTSQSGGIHNKDFDISITAEYQELGNLLNEYEHHVDQMGFLKKDIQTVLDKDGTLEQAQKYMNELENTINSLKKLYPKIHSQLDSIGYTGVRHTK